MQNGVSYEWLDISYDSIIFSQAGNFVESIQVDYV